MILISQTDALNQLPTDEVMIAYNLWKNELKPKISEIINCNSYYDFDLLSVPENLVMWKHALINFYLFKIIFLQHRAENIILGAIVCNGN